MVAVCVTLGLLVTACSGGAKKSAARRGGHAHVGAAAAAVRLSITPAGGSTDAAPNRGITVTADGGRISRVIVRTRGDPVTGTLNAAGTVWHSTWALDVSQRYAVVATAVGASGKPVTQTSSFRTLTPRQSFRAQIIEGSRQTYGVGIPIILFFSLNPPGWQVGSVRT